MGLVRLGLWRGSVYWKPLILRPQTAALQVNEFGRPSPFRQRHSCVGLPEDTFPLLVDDGVTGQRADMVARLVTQGNFFDPATQSFTARLMTYNAELRQLTYHVVRVCCVCVCA